MTHSTFVPRRALLISVLALMPLIAHADCVEDQILAPATGQNGDMFGGAATIDGGTLALGATAHDESAMVPSSGLVRVYDVGAGGWTLRATLDRDPPESAGDFGWAVSLDGDRLAIGALGNGAAANAGAVLIHERDEGGTNVWGRVATLLGDGTHANLGYSVALAGDTLVAGEPESSDTCPPGDSSCGAARVYVRGAGGWTLQAVLGASDADSYDAFGNSVAFDGETIVVGAPYADHAGVRPGAAYVFERNGAGAWEQVAQFRDTELEDFDGFGSSVAVSAGRIVVGAPGEADALGVRRGSVHAYRKDAAGWAETQVIRACDGEASDFFGKTVALEGLSLLVGAPGDDDVADEAGSAHRFEDDPEGSYMHRAKLLASDGASSDHFSNFHGAALSGDRSLLGSPVSDGSSAAPGTAYVFTCEHESCGAGPDVTLDCGASTISRTATGGDAGCGAMTLAWTATGGCGASFSAPSSASTDISFADPCHVSECVITFTVTDSAGGQCADSLTVTPDTTPPVVTACAPNYNLGCTGARPPKYPGQPGYAYGYPVTSDACATATVVSDTSIPSGCCKPTIVRTWRVTDVCGNATYCLQTFTYCW